MRQAWTSVAAEDSFVRVAAGRSAFRVSDLLALAALVDGLGSAGTIALGRMLLAGRALSRRFCRICKNIFVQRGLTQLQQ